VTLLDLRWRMRLVGLVLMALLLALGLLLPDRRPLLAQICVAAIFALSYDLLEGFGGIVSLGHAAYFGLGAYTAAVLAGAGLSEPITGLLLSGMLAGLAAGVLAPVIVRGTDFTRLLITLGVGLMLFEAANQMRWLTGGADGLAGFDPGLIAGLFAFDYLGSTGFFYALAVLAVVYAAMLRIVTSPFGLSLAGIRERARRMPALGASIPRHLGVAYTISGAVAGMAGAVLAQTGQNVALDALGFERSAEVTMMVAIGGIGRLYGAVLGSAVFIEVKDELSAIAPAYWQMGLGLALVVLVLFARGGLSPLAERLMARR